ncbi:unnamed protein product [Lasius platythorax]|uniref:Uncharacterized protein n=1 Tax=Lasius platythorax TaxID=488582 RepID=A0AAV2PAT6_9HYME
MCASAAIGRVDIRAIIAAIGHLFPRVHCLMGHTACTHEPPPARRHRSMGLRYSAGVLRVARVNPQCVNSRREFVSPCVSCIVPTTKHGVGDSSARDNDFTNLD